MPCRSPMYSFTPLAVETLGALGEEASVFFRELGQRNATDTGEPRSCQFLLQRLSVIVQRGNAACILGTVSSARGLDAVFQILFITVFAKMQFFKISVIYAFLLLCFFFFFYPASYLKSVSQLVSRPIYTKCGTKGSPHVGFRRHFRNLEKKIKKQVTTSKKLRNLLFDEISWDHHIFAQCYKTVKLKKKLRNKD